MAIGDSAGARSDYLKLDEGDYEIDVLSGSRKMPPEDGPNTTFHPEDGYESVVYTFRDGVSWRDLEEIDIEEMDGTSLEVYPSKQKVVVGLPYKKLANNATEAGIIASAYFQRIGDALNGSSQRDLTVDSSEILNQFRKMGEEEK